MVVLAVEKQAISFCLLYEERKQKFIEWSNSWSINTTNNATRIILTFSNYINQTVSKMNPNCRRTKIPTLAWSTSHTVTTSNSIWQ